VQKETSKKTIDTDDADGMNHFQRRDDAYRSE